MRPTFFATPGELGKWLKTHHGSHAELWVGFYKKGCGKPSITWPESVDEALCVGWIDGIRKSLGAESYVIRFTPRKAASTWSAINIARMAVLIEEGRVHPGGLAAFARRSEKKSGIYAYEQRSEAKLGPTFLERFRANTAAWKYFEARPRGYRQKAVWWVVNAKREETRQSRLERLIALSAEGREI